MQKNTNNKIKLILVHGTFAPDTPWIQKNSTFRKAIDLHCPGCEIPEELFQWSGGNSVKQRQEASDKLITEIGKTTNRNIFLSHTVMVGMLFFELY